MAIPELLHDLLTAVGPSGAEDAAARVWREAATSFATVHGDTLGTSFARVGSGTGPTLAVIGHIDEIGFAITHIDGEGILSFSTLGGFDAEVLAGQRILIAGRGGPVEGVVGVRARPRRERADRTGLRRDDLHIDIGATSAEDAGARVAAGDVGVWHGEPLELPNGRIVSRALDNRLGAYAALEAARRIADGGGIGANVVAVASVQEEISHDGARTAAFAVEPDVALVLDVTWATDAPGESAKAGREGGARLRGGDHSRAGVEPARLGPARPGRSGGRDPTHDRGPLGSNPYRRRRRPPEPSRGAHRDRLDPDPLHAHAVRARGAR